MEYIQALATTMPAGLQASKFGRYRGVRSQDVVLKREREGGREGERKLISRLGKEMARSIWLRFEAKPL